MEDTEVYSITKNETVKSIINLIESIPPCNVQYINKNNIKQMHIKRTQLTTAKCKCTSSSKKESKKTL
ncbi:hypothetical protein RirG_140140 [Rhizophagus irregularis DAOM 197198w]|nr:hypothetical protein RirG_140140 [Rhizophagus irregularis DAOM 197198w]